MAPINFHPVGRISHVSGGHISGGHVARQPVVRIFPRQDSLQNAYRPVPAPGVRCHVTQFGGDPVGTEVRGSGAGRHVMQPEALIDRPEGIGTEIAFGNRD